MSVYYINSNGTSTAPFDTPEKGAMNLSVLNNSGLLISNDIVEMVDPLEFVDLDVKKEKRIKRVIKTYTIQDRLNAI